MREPSQSRERLGWHPLPINIGRQEGGGRRVRMLTGGAVKA